MHRVRRNLQRRLCANPPDKVSTRDEFQVFDFSFYGDLTVTTYDAEARMFAELARTARDAEFAHECKREALRFAVNSTTVDPEEFADADDNGEYKNYKRACVMTDEELRETDDFWLLLACLWARDWRRVLLFKPRFTKLWATNHGFSIPNGIKVPDVENYVRVLRTMAAYNDGAGRFDAEHVILFNPPLIKYVDWDIKSPDVRVIADIADGKVPSLEGTHKCYWAIFFRVALYYKNEAAFESMCRDTRSDIGETVRADMNKQ